MKTIRKEVQTFVQATETLLSPILLGEELNEDERGMVAMCLQSLAKEYATQAPSPQETHSGTNGQHRLRESQGFTNRRW